MPFFANLTIKKILLGEKLCEPKALTKTISPQLIISQLPHDKVNPGEYKIKGLFWKCRICMRNLGQTHHLLIAVILDQETWRSQLIVTLNLASKECYYKHPRWNLLPTPEKELTETTRNRPDVILMNLLAETPYDKEERAIRCSIVEREWYFTITVTQISFINHIMFAW